MRTIILSLVMLACISCESDEFTLYNWRYTITTTSKAYVNNTAVYDTYRTYEVKEGWTKTQAAEYAKSITYKNATQSRSCTYEIIP